MALQSEPIPRAGDKTVSSFPGLKPPDFQRGGLRSLKRPASSTGLNHFQHQLLPNRSQPKLYGSPLAYAKQTTVAPPSSPRLFTGGVPNATTNDGAVETGYVPETLRKKHTAQRSPTWFDSQPFFEKSVLNISDNIKFDKYNRAVWAKESIHSTPTGYNFSRKDDVRRMLPQVSICCSTLKGALEKCLVYVWACSRFAMGLAVAFLLICAIYATWQTIWLAFTIIGDFIQLSFGGAFSLFQGTFLAVLPGTFSSATRDLQEPRSLNVQPKMVASKNLDGGSTYDLSSSHLTKLEEEIVTLENQNAVMTLALGELESRIRDLQTSQRELEATFRKVVGQIRMMSEIENELGKCMNNIVNDMAAGDEKIGDTGANCEMPQLLDK